MTSTAIGPSLARFAASRPYAFDDFQLRACRALEAGRGVLVCAPTGAGKTVVGEFAAALALAGGTKCFYTTPIKALSNQKYADLAAEHGADAVGLLTGDSSVNPAAPIVVMTTEVLRNMIYADSAALAGLSHVVMDEVHFLADRFRGAVWEEVILHLSADVRVVSLSATVSNAEEFGAWMTQVRGDTEVIVDEHRPVPLTQHMLVGSRIYDLYAPDGRINPDLEHASNQRTLRDRGRVVRVNRPELLLRLARDGLLPAISFIFSRGGCDGAFDQCVRSGVDLAPAGAAKEIRAVALRHLRDVPDGDWDVLGVDRWLTGLQRGFAAHHAGLLPAFRHAVEELFATGMLQAVFATETLALGINMPARSVVLERLVKYNGEAHVELTPGEYTQLTGRAGRRGIDIEGHAIVVDGPDVTARGVAGLAGARTFALRSSFTPEYNMAVNLLDRLGVEGSTRLLEQSFAQYQTDRSVVGASRRLDETRRQLWRASGELERAAEAAGIEADDIDAYSRLRQDIAARERELQHTARETSVAETIAVLAALSRGTIIGLYGRRHRGLAVVVEPSRNDADPQPRVLCEDGWAGPVRAGDFLNPPRQLGRLRLPKQADTRTGRGRRDLASALRASGVTLPRGPQRRRKEAADDKRLAALRRELRGHPVHALRDEHDLMRAAERVGRLRREAATAESSIAGATGSLVRTFERVLGVLIELGYLDGGRSSVELTDAGRMLRRIYSEADLVVCEALRAGIWDGLAPSELAAVVSALVYSSRGDGVVDVDLVTGRRDVRDALRATEAVWRVVTTVERKHRLPTTRDLDPGFVSAVGSWADGRPLATALSAAGASGTGLPPGDFVRSARMVVDLLEQIRGVAAAQGLPIAATARSAARAVHRGVVVADSL